LHIVLVLSSCQDRRPVLVESLGKCTRSERVIYWKFLQESKLDENIWYCTRSERVIYLKFLQDSKLDENIWYFTRSERLIYWKFLQESKLAESLMKTMNLVKTINTRSDTQINSSLIYIIWKFDIFNSVRSGEKNPESWKIDFHNVSTR
jgi:hypothetical protein